ncbi:hypothetical protein E1A91_D03G081700v1 [Gossypium mustelinum]|uniref:Uncharacterized protein n=1 Tax=Gossypium mustelinum TaxID=34275 RepID=A0A5D2VKK1_GOSMU|nr:hypothetical protein E1A91_D03G081700v1 [Gossypium mustelinum]
MYSPIVNLSLSVFQAFLITFKESLSISAWVIPQSLPTVTACTQVMAFAAKTEAQMAQTNIRQTSTVLFNKT